MNTMMMRARERLDGKVIECLDFKERSRKTQKELESDLSRLAQQIANNARVQTTTLSAMEQADASVQHAKETQAREQIAYKHMRRVDQAQLDQREKDLANTEYMLRVTRCKGAFQDSKKTAKFLQHRGVSQNGAATGSDATLATTGLEACFDRSANGDLDLEVTFKDPRLENSMRNLTSEGRRLLQIALSRAEFLSGGAAAATLRAVGMSYGPDLVEDLEDGDEPGPPPSEDSFSALQQFPMPTVPPAEKPTNEFKQANKCMEMEPTCGLLHDTFAGLWGDMKDVVDLSRRKIAEDDRHWKTIYEGVNAQIHDLSAHKTELGSTLAEASSARAAQVDQQSKKQLEQRQVTDRVGETLVECKSTIRTILFSEMCAVAKVRNALLLANKKDVGPEDIVDCEVSEWVPSECSVPCDDSLVGGNMTLRREVMVTNSKYGAKCPSLTLTRRCNQVKCPVDCKVSNWTTWSKCTKECGGGIQTRTREILQKPRFGGMACTSSQEARPCNTGSCDKNCKLGAWTDFTSCSKACNGGYQERRKNVVEPVRGNGRCPNPESRQRYRKKLCNAQKCVGDEVCLQKADLILAIDGSGSLTAKGFEVVKEFAARLVMKFKPMAYGHEAMRVSVVQFGNGRLDANKVVSDAKLILMPTDDMNKVSQSIRKMTWQRGFTNVAQALLKAQTVLRSRSRPHANSVVMLLTDGRPTFKLQTANAVASLRKNARLVVVQVQAFRKKDSVNTLKRYASIPWQTNYIHIPGKKALKGASDHYITQVVAQLCPFAESPSATKKQDALRGYRKIRVGMSCKSEPGVETIQMTTDACFLRGNTMPDGMSLFAYGEQRCIVYSRPCSNFTRNNSFDIYEPLKTSPVSSLQEANGADVKYFLHRGVRR